MPRATAFSIPSGVYEPITRRHVPKIGRRVRRRRLGRRLGLGIVRQPFAILAAAITLLACPPRHRGKPKELAVSTTDELIETSYAKADAREPMASSRQGSRQPIEWRVGKRGGERIDKWVSRKKRRRDAMEESAGFGTTSGTRKVFIQATATANPTPVSRLLARKKKSRRVLCHECTRSWTRKSDEGGAGS